MRKTPATLRAEQEAALWKSRAHTVKAEYDVLKSNKLRRQPKRETKDEGGIYTPQKRVYGVNIGRDLERNYSSARGIITQFRANVVGSEGKLQVNVPGGDQAANWFNKDWARHCDFRDDIHFSQVCQNVVAAAMREGDMLAVFDDDLIDDSGKLLTWEADQVVPLSHALAKERFGNDVVQDGGIVRDKWGRVTHFVATGKRGLSVIENIEDASIWKRNQAVMPRSPWRLNQGRGAAPMLTAASSLMDLYEMLSKELITAKKAAGNYAMVNRKDSVDDWDDPGSHPEYLPENDGKAAATVAAEGANSETSSARNYEALEALTGGYTDYGVPGDEIHFAPTDRPNVHMAEFIEAVLCHAGAAFGLARAYAMLRADTSYTAFRGDMILSWAGAFYPAQKWLERSFADWVGVKALSWAQRHNKIPRLPAGWEMSLSWKWPTMPEVDQLDYENAVAQALKNGTTDYATLLGPEWEKRLEGLAKQLEVIRKLDLPLSILEMKSGGAANTKKEEKTTTGGAK